MVFGCPPPGRKWSATATTVTVWPNTSFTRAQLARAA